MTRRTIAAGVGYAIPARNGKTPGRRFWSHWMRRALAPHAREMAVPHQPIFAIDIEPDTGGVDAMQP
jgi:hypothetical protein